MSRIIERWTMAFVVGGEVKSQAKVRSGVAAVGPDQADGGEPFPQQGQ
jgi:hypothetical protein